MYKIFYLLAFVILLSSCENTAEENRRFSAYFDVDSLLDAQLSILHDMDIRVMKAAELNNNTDTSSYMADSIRLMHELNVFRKANINKPAFDGLYGKEIYDSADMQIVKYLPIEADNDLEVKVLKLYYEDSGLKTLEARVEEDHWLYDSKRKLKISFSPKEGRNLIDDFRLAGTQKMILRDRVNFVIEGAIIPSGISGL